MITTEGGGHFHNVFSQIIYMFVFLQVYGADYFYNVFFIDYLYFFSQIIFTFFTDSYCRFSCFFLDYFTVCLQGRSADILDPNRGGGNFYKVFSQIIHSLCIDYLYVCLQIINYLYVSYRFVAQIFMIPTEGGGRTRAFHRFFICFFYRLFITYTFFHRLFLHFCTGSQRKSS